MKGTDSGETIMSKRIAPPVPLGSYPPSDVRFLLKDLSNVSWSWVRRSGRKPFSPG